MISKSDALTNATEASGDSINWKVDEQVVPLRDVHMLIRSIYESVGSCKVCVHDTECDTQSFMGLPYGCDWYCSDFEKKHDK